VDAIGARCKTLYLRSTLAAWLLLASAAWDGGAHAAEGMWTFDNFPSATVAARYGFGPDAAWLDRVRAAAVRLSSGCSASVVSADGLVLTNHHCVLDCVQSLASARHHYVEDGFVTHKRAEEKPCPGMQAEILESMTDVTAQMSAAIQAAEPAAITQARDAAMADIEQRACAGERNAHCQVVSLYQGSQYQLYRYRSYHDVRLVFAPELAVAFFGGDLDNFNFPRFCLDSALLRLYEDGAAARTPAHLRWRRDAPAAGELVFVAGNPGATSRLATIAQLAQQRDVVIPARQLMRAELRGRLTEFAALGEAQRRAATAELFTLENTYKAFAGMEKALQDAQFFELKMQQERQLRARLAEQPLLARQIGDPWSVIALATAQYNSLFLPHDFLEQRAGSFSALYQYARTLVRGAAERDKPSAQRLREFADSNLPLLQRGLLDPRPVCVELERMALSYWLAKTREYLTADSSAARNLLGDESPERLAARLINGTRLADPKVRAALWTGGSAAIAASDDALIQFVRAHDADARAVRTLYEQQVEGPIMRASEAIARARFALDGAGPYPDATFTLRLSYGDVAGWSDRGQTVKPFTTIGALYERANGAEPFRLPARWLQARARLDPDIPLDVATTNDIIGGNSGSPLIDAEGRIVGAVFDGNIYCAGGYYRYDGRINRSIAVLTAAIGPALREVYQLPQLADELESGSSH
jgi:hypothetical protein